MSTSTATTYMGLISEQPNITEILTKCLRFTTSWITWFAASEATPTQSWQLESSIQDPYAFCIFTHHKSTTIFLASPLHLLETHPTRKESSAWSRLLLLPFVLILISRIRQLWIATSPMETNSQQTSSLLLNGQTFLILLFLYPRNQLLPVLFWATFGL